MQNQSLIVSTIAAMMCFSTTVYADMPVPYGWYLEGNAGESTVSDKSYPGSADTGGIGGNVNLGYKFMPYFGLEVGYTQYGNVTIKDNDDTKAGTDKHDSYDLAGKGMVPIGDSGFEAFAKLGLSRVTSKTTINDTPAANSIGLTSDNHSAIGLYLAAGGEYYFTPEFALVGQWARANGDSSTGVMDLWSLGLSFLFG